jgi:hypothetical protein
MRMLCPCIQPLKVVAMHTPAPPLLPATLAIFCCYSLLPPLPAYVDLHAHLHRSASPLASRASLLGFDAARFKPLQKMHNMYMRLFTVVQLARLQVQHTEGSCYEHRA